MTEIEKKVVEYAKSVDWDINKVINRVNDFNDPINGYEWSQLNGDTTTEKVSYIFRDHMPKSVHKTKVRVLDQEYSKKPVPIELKFVPSLVGCTGYANISYKSKKHSFWDNIVLISENYENGWDLILVYKDSYEPNSTVKLKKLVLGKWNDGVIESDN